MNDARKLVTEYLVRKAAWQGLANVQSQIADRATDESGPNRLAASDWNDPAWTGVPVVEIGGFLKESSAHRPRTEARLMYDAEGLHGIFRVQDRFVRCVRTEYFGEVWKDSAVEFFFQPPGSKGYFNFECNCGGAFLICFITNPERTADGFKEFVKVPKELGREIRVTASLPKTVEPEIQEPVMWTLRFFIPFSLIQHYTGPLGVFAGSIWRGNFYKCAEELSHPHWAAWSAVDEFNFHLPRCFGVLRFEG